MVIAPHNIPLIRIAHLKTAATTGNFAERAKWKWEIAQKIYNKGWANKDIIILYNIVDTMMSLPKPLQAEFSAKVKRLEEELKMPLISPTIELALEEGEQRGELKGEIKGKQELIIKQLNRRVGELQSSLIKQVKALDVEALEELGEILLDFSIVTDLEQWLNSRPKPVES